MKKLFAILALLSATGSVFAQNVQINGAGATFPYPIYSKWFDEYHKSHPTAQINYQSIGSGGGIRQLSAGTVFFGATDGPMTNDQILAAGFRVIHLPTVLGGVVPIYNAPGVNAQLIGPFRPAAYLTAYAFLSLPNAFAATAIQFALALRSGRPMAAYLGSLFVVFMGFFVASLLLFRRGLGTLLDPVGIRFVIEDIAQCVGVVVADGARLCGGAQSRWCGSRSDVGAQTTPAREVDDRGNRVVLEIECAAALHFKRADTLLAQLAQAPTRGLAAIKRALYASDSTLEQALDLERDLQRELGYSADYREGVEAFLAKRPPRFTGH